MAGQIFAELEELKKAGLTADVKKKLKKANDGLKNVEKNLEESIKQCGIEANKRASAEAELTRNAGLVDLMTRTVTMMMCQVGELGGAAGPAQGMADQRQQAAASGWEEEQVYPLGWEERLHLPHGWMGSRSTGWEE